MLSMEKVCTKCSLKKDLLLFPAKKKAKDGHASWCRACFKANWDVRYRENHQHYRDSHNTSRRKIREQNARKVFDYLTHHPCVNCGESDPIVLEFDHRDRIEKSECISILILNSSWERVELEIEKCDVLCANCHRRKSAAEFNYKRHIFVNI
ncbi:MAG: hypothetical protein H0X72_18575 [Acidobacteria bacterium]|nr:hypothetical protein [Acidobacteriota bacterium]